MLPRHWPDDGPPLRIAYRYSGAGRGGRSARRVVSDVRHIAVPSSIRSFETLVCRLFRDGANYQVRHHGIASAHAICPSKPSSVAMAR
jgi:hypothetical protein